MMHHSWRLLKGTDLPHCECWFGLVPSHATCECSPLTLCVVSRFCLPAAVLCCSSMLKAPPHPYSSADYKGSSIVVFMHNIVGGREHTLKSVGPNNTDPGYWPRFQKQHCLTVDMAFDEGKLDLNDVNRRAIDAVVNVVLARTKQSSVSMCSQNEGRQQLYH